MTKRKDFWMTPTIRKHGVHRDYDAILDDLTSECDALGRGVGSGEVKDALIREMHDHPMNQHV